MTINTKYLRDFTPIEAAKYIGVEKTMVYTWIKKGVLSARNVGQGGIRPRWIIKEEDLRDFKETYTYGAGKGNFTNHPKKEKQETEQPEEQVESDWEEDILRMEIAAIKDAMLALAVKLEELEKKLPE